MRRTAVLLAGFILAWGSAAWASDAGEGARQGQVFYLRHCASCHGDTARGDGVRAQAFRRQPADLTQLSRRYSSPLPKGILLGAILRDSRPGGPGVCGDPVLVWLPPGLGRHTMLRGMLMTTIAHLQTVQTVGADAVAR